MIIGERYVYSIHDTVQESLVLPVHRQPLQPVNVSINVSSYDTSDIDSQAEEVFFGIPFMSTGLAATDAYTAR